MAEYLPLICIDPGHGGRDSGAVGNGMLEKALNWRFANALAQVLTDGYKCRVVIVQPSTEFNSTGQDELVIPPQRSNEMEADYYISLHCNAGGGNGYESFCKKGDEGTEADRIRRCINYGILKELAQYGLRGHGNDLKYENFYVLVNTVAYSSLHELAFIDSGVDAELLRNPLTFWRAAIGIASGLEIGRVIARKDV